jgi:hypothetical protein
MWQGAAAILFDVSLVLPPLAVLVGLLLIAVRGRRTPDRSETTEPLSPHRAA